VRNEGPERGRGGGGGGGGGRGLALIHVEKGGEKRTREEERRRRKIISETTFSTKVRGHSTRGRRPGAHTRSRGTHNTHTHNALRVETEARINNVAERNGKHILPYIRVYREPNSLLPAPPSGGMREVSRAN